MAKEYKFMFDRRFDEPEEEEKKPEPVEESSIPTDGLPSISQLLDTLNEQMQTFGEQIDETPNTLQQEEAELAEQIKKSRVQPEFSPDAPSVDDSAETPAAEEKEVEKEEETEFAVPSIAELYKEEEKTLPTISVNELEDAKNEAREEGRLNGLTEGRENAWKEAMESIEKQNSDTLMTISASLKKSMQSLEQSAENAFETAIEIAMAVCKKALPSLCEKNAVDEIRILLEKNLHFLKDEPKISLRLNPTLAEQIKPVLTELVKKEAYAGRIAVIRDETLPVGDCRVEWKNGGLEKNMQDVLNHTEELVRLYTHTSSADEHPANQTGEKQNG